MAHSLDLTVTHSLIVSAFHPTSFTDSMPVTSGKILSFFTNLARRTETTTFFVNVKNTSFHPIIGVISCCTILVPSKVMIYLGCAVFREALEASRSSVFCGLGSRSAFCCACSAALGALSVAHVLLLASDACGAALSAPSAASCDDSP